MKVHKIMLAGIVAAFVISVLISPALAHRKYRANPYGTPKWVLQRHSHDQEETVKSPKIKSDLVKKTFKRSTYRQHSPGGGPGKWVRQPQPKPAIKEVKAVSVKKYTRRSRYYQHPPGGGPARWVRKH